GRVGRAQLCGLTLRGGEPHDPKPTPGLPGRGAPGAPRGGEGIVFESAAWNRRQPLVEKRGQRAQDARLGLSAQSEKDEVVLREDGVLELRNDRLVVADDAREQGSSLADGGNQVFAQLLLHGARAVSR